MARKRLFTLAAAAAILFLTAPVHAARISAEAQRHFDRGTAAMEIAKTPQDYQLAIEEFEQAVLLAPKWPKAYYNLGLAQEKVGRFKDAVGSFQRYLELSPHAPDAAAVRTLVNKDEFKAEQTVTDADALAIFGSLGALGEDAKPNGQSRWRLRGATVSDRVNVRLVSMRISPGPAGQIAVSTVWSRAPVSKILTVPHRKTLSFKFKFFLCDPDAFDPEGCARVETFQLVIRSKREVTMHVDALQFGHTTALPKIYDNDYKFVRR